MLAGGAYSTTENPNSDWTSYSCNNYIPRGDLTGAWNHTYAFHKLPNMDCDAIGTAITFPSKSQHLRPALYVRLLTCRYLDCWNGRDVDSPNHRDHMSYGTGEGWRCPKTHPYQLPQITLEFQYWAHDYEWEDIVLSSGSVSGQGPSTP
jgi:hypothetical protein